MRKLLWIGDAAVSTGFARCTHKVLDVLQHHYEVHVLGLNYQGDPHPYPYPIYPCNPGGDAFGVGRTKWMVDRVQPDVIVIQNDPWNIPAYIDKIENPNIKVIATMPVDGKNCRGNWLNSLDLAIFWTKFGLDEAREGGYTGPADVIPLGVDLNLYCHRPKKNVRKALAGLPEEIHDAFIVGNVNRNQPRKRLDLSISYFAQWVKDCNIDDAYLFLHVAPTGDQGYDVRQLMKYYGLNKRLILAEPEIGLGVQEIELAHLYCVFDIQLSTTQGEGWGLTTMEGMACGVPQIVPDWSALGEWVGDGAIKVPCSEIAVTPNNVNVVGGVPDRRDTVEALNDLYTQPKLREQLFRAGRKIVNKPEYRWGRIGLRFVEALAGMAEERKTA